MLVSVLQTHAVITLTLSLLLKCCLPTTLFKYTDNCSQHSRTNKLLLDNCDLTKITAVSHTTNERMFSSLIVREVARKRAVTINMHPPQIVCTDIT
jgi:hypothetical protein